MKTETITRIQELGLLAVLRAPSAEDAVKISDALIAGGVKGIEITFTTPNALQAVSDLNQKYGDEIMLGMGTLTDRDQPAAAKLAGARFLVSPHTEPSLAHSMGESGLPFMMGALTPSEVVKASKLGADVVKLFPGSLGGAAYMRSLRAPFPKMKIMPTGGVNLENIVDWFTAGAFAVGVGSALFPKTWVKEGKFDEITKRARLYAERVTEAKRSQI